MKSDTFEDIISLNEDIDYVTEHKRIKKYSQPLLFWCSLKTHKKFIVLFKLSFMRNISLNKK